MTHRIWMGLLESDRASRYYSRLADKYASRYRIGYGFLALCGVATETVAVVISLQGGILGYILLAPSTLAVMSGVALFWYQDAGKVHIARSIAGQYSTLHKDFARLWYQEKPDEALVTLLTERTVSISSTLDADTDYKICQETEKESDQVVAGTFQTAA